MSLINDALKKAQRQRTGEAPPLAAMPGVGGESAVRIAKRAKPAGFNTLLLRAGVGAGALLVLGVGGYFAFRGQPADATVTPPPVAQSPATQLPAPASAPSADPATSFVLPVAPPTSPVNAPAPKAAVTVATPPAKTAAPATVTATPSPATTAPAGNPPLSAPAAPAQPPAKMEGKAVAYIENLRIAGIRASTTDAKVLMNDRVYRQGDMVEHELGLKLVGITAGSLTFEDPQGARYTRSF
jgi:hypothetical protein